MTSPTPPSDARSDAARPAEPAGRVRCYACGRKQDVRLDTCGRCGAVFRGICPCGAQHSVYASACGGCGARLVPKRLPRSRHPAVRAVRWGVLGLIVLAGAAVWFGRRTAEAPYATKERATALFRAGRYAEAAKLYEAVTRATPRDAQAWYNLAASYRGLRLASEVQLPPARKAVELAPQMFRAQLVLSAIEREAGNLSAALEHARAAAALPDATVEAFQVLAETEILQPDPDLQAVIAACRRLLARNRDSVEGKILLAECYVRLYGDQDAASYPVEVAAAFAEARDAVSDPSVSARSPQAALLRARLQLCSGQADQAYGTALETLDAATPETPDAVRAALLVIRARAALAWRDYREGARSDLLQALALRPELDTALSIAAPLTASGRADLVEDVLATAAAKKDPAGSLTLVLAQVQIDRGEPDAALESLRRAASTRPQSDPLIPLFRGDALRAKGDREGARAAYADAAKAEPAWDQPVLRLAGLAATEPAGPARDEAVRNAIADVTARSVADPRNARLLAARARLLLAARDVAGAIREATAAVDVAPGAPDLWVLLAEAHAADASPDAPTRAALAMQRARMLRPDDVDLVRSEMRACLRAGDPGGAAAAATRYLERHPDARDVRLARARAEMQLGQWRSAGEDFRRLLQDDASDGALVLECAEAQFRARDREGALRTLGRLQEGAPRAVTDGVTVLRAQLKDTPLDDLIEELRRTGADALLARVYLGLGRLADAAEAARGILAARPGDPDATQTLVFALLDGASGDAGAREEAGRAVDALAARAPAGLAPLLRARILIDEQRWAEADALLTEHEADLPPGPVPAYLMGVAALRCGRTDQGLSRLDRALALPGAPAALPRLVADEYHRASVATRDPRQVEARARRALQLAPEHAGAAAVLCDVLARRGDLAGALAVVERVLQGPRISREDAVALRTRAAALSNARGRMSAAAIHLGALAQLDPDSGWVPLLAGHSLLVRGDADGAARAFEAARAKLPDAGLPVIGLIAANSQRSLVDAATQLHREWLEAHPDDRFVTLVGAQILERDARIDGAAQVLRDALAARPGDAVVAETLVGVLTRAGRFDEALAAGRLLAKAAPGDLVAELVAARAAAARGESSGEAIERAGRVLAASSAPPRLRVAARAVEASALLRLGRLEEAATASRAGLAEVETGAPGEPAIERSFRAVLGHCALARRDPAGAATEFRRCVTLGDDDADDLNNLAWALAETPDGAKEGHGFATRATDLRPDDPNLWATRAHAADAAREPDDAESSYRRCLEILAGAPGRDPGLRGRTALRLAAFLRSRERAEEAREVARAVLTWDPAPPGDVLDDARRMTGP